MHVASKLPPVAFASGSIKVHQQEVQLLFVPAVVKTGVLHM